MSVEEVRRELAGIGPKGSARPISVFPVDNADGTLDMIYMFQIGQEVRLWRFAVREDQELPSISDLYKGALNMEREAVDLFGLRFAGVQGGLLLGPDSPVRAPLRKPRKKVTEAEAKEGGDA
ncbi:MAG: NADH-quinone oxidoreductase subunit C [Methanomassiliicoccales archaeon]|jgi:NADH:ubiquinone oxidoreductase subunit C|nr:NADH-quinone oxidoreductase subunit C [Methanomassiliicoccales archaeon]